MGTPAWQAPNFQPSRREHVLCTNHAVCTVQALARPHRVSSSARTPMLIRRQGSGTSTAQSGRQPGWSAQGQEPAAQEATEPSPQRRPDSTPPAARPPWAGDTTPSPLTFHVVVEVTGATCHLLAAQVDLGEDEVWARVTAERCPSPSQAPPASSTRASSLPLCPPGAQLGALKPGQHPRSSSRPTKARVGAPGAHLHVVTLLLLHLRMDTQLLPGAQHTHSGPGGGDGWGAQGSERGAPVLSSGRSHVGCTGSPGKLGSHARPGSQREWLGRKSTPGSRGAFTAARPALSQHPGRARRRGRETGAGLGETLPPACSLSGEAGGEGTPTPLRQCWGLQHGAGPPPAQLP